MGRSVPEPRKQTPSIGRVVHFMYGDVHVPAIIIDPTYPYAEKYVQAIQVFTLRDGTFSTIAKEDPDCAPSTWHWPEYVP
jgi:hypothetical protein